MNKKEVSDCREELRQWAVKWTKCSIQEGWPCGTCLLYIFGQLGVSEDKKHNKPINRVNEVWRAMIQIRENE